MSRDRAKEWKLKIDGQQVTLRRKIYKCQGKKKDGGKLKPYNKSKKRKNHTKVKIEVLHKSP